MRGPDARYATGKSNVTSRAVKVLCPYHDDNTPSMAVFADGTRCFVCGAEESSWDYLKRMEVGPDEVPEVDYIEYKKNRTTSRTYVPTTGTVAKVDIYHDLLMDTNSPRHYKMNWYVERGIFRHTIRKRKLGHTGTRFSIPIWYGEEMTGLKFRLDEEFHSPEELKRSKYYGATGQPILLYRPEPHISDEVFITEGELDALALSQYGFDAVTTTGGSDTLHQYLTPDRLRTVSPVVMVDMDEAGHDAYKLLCEVWNEPLRRLYMPEGMDLSQWLCSIETINKREHIERVLEEGY